MNNLKILFVDDEQETTDKYVKHLKRKYTSVYSSYDGLDAYKMYKEKVFSLKILNKNYFPVSFFKKTFSLFLVCNTANLIFQVDLVQEESLLR